MSFCKLWDEQYQSGSHQSIWPWSKVVSLVSRSCKDLSGKNVLEIGCGAGANIPFFISKKVNYYGIEGSEYQSQVLRNRFQEPNIHIINGDFTKAIDVDVPIDLALDRGALTCNATADIQRTIDNIYQKLTWDGVIIGIDWYSKEDFAYQNKENVTKIIDESTLEFSSGCFANIGALHFFDIDEIQKLLANFKIILLEENKTINILDRNITRVAFNVVAQKIKKTS